MTNASQFANTSGVNIGPAGTLTVTAAPGTWATTVTGSGVWNLDAPSNTNWTQSTANLSGFTGTLNIGPTVGLYGGGVTNYPGAGATINIANGGQLNVYQTMSSPTGTINLNGGAGPTWSGNANLGAIRTTSTGIVNYNINVNANSTIGCYPGQGGGTYAGNIALGINTLTVNTQGNLTINGALSGSGTLASANANNTYQLFVGGNNSGFTGTFLPGAASPMLFTSSNAGSAGAIASLGVSGGNAYLEWDSSSSGTVQLGALTDGGYSSAILENYNANNGTTGTFQIGGLNTNTTFSGTIQNAAAAGNSMVAITKVGSGSLTLKGVNTYSGGTTISGGTLALSNASANNIASSPCISLASGATLDTTALSGGAGLTLSAAQTLSGAGTLHGPLATVSGSTVVPGSATTLGTLSTGNLNLASGSNLTFVLGTPGNSSPGSGSLINVNGNLTLPGSGLNVSFVDNANNGGLGSLGNGLYELFAYSGSLSGFNAASTFAAQPTGKIYTFTNPVGQIDVTISLPTPLTWTGLTGGTAGSDSGWNATSTNWANGASTVSYADGTSSVTFGDTNAANGGAPITNSTVTISGTNVSPCSVTFNNANVNYTLNGTAGIAGATGIVVSGSGLVSLQNSNSFTGPVAINAGALNISNSAALGNSSGVTVAAGAALQVQGGITSGAIPLGLNGTGLAASPAGALNNVSGNNTYAGAITLNGPSTIAASAGTLTLSGGVATGSNQLTVAGTGNTTFSAGISGSGSLLMSGSGQLTLTAASSYTGGTTITAGTLQLGDGATASGSVSGNIVNNAALVIANPNAQNYSGNISGNGGFTKSGGGVLTLSGSNTYSGPTIINAGTLRLSGGTGGTLPSGLQIMPLGDSITEGSNGTNGGYRGFLYSLLSPIAPGFQFIGVSNSNPGSLPTSPINETYHNGFSSYTSVNLYNNLNGLDLQQYNTYGGSDRNPQGGYWLTGGGTTGRGAVYPNIILCLVGANDVNQGIAGNAQTNLYNLINEIVTLRPNTHLIMADMTPYTGFSSTVAAYNAVMNSEVAQFQAAGDNVSVVDLNTNFPAGGSDGLHPNNVGYSWMANQWLSAIEALYPGSSAAIPATSPTSVALGATLDLSGCPAATVGPLSGAGSVTLGGGILTVNSTTGNNSTFSGVISGSGSFVKAGPAMLTLNGSNTYGGATAINAGTLALGGSGSIAASPAVSIASGATLDVTAVPGGYGVPAGQTISGAGTISVAAGAALTLNSGAAISAGSSGVGVLTINGGTLALNSGSALNFGASLGVNSQIAVIGALNLAGSGIAVNLYQAGTNSPYTTDGTYTLATYGSLAGSTSNLLAFSSNDLSKLFSYTASSGNLTLSVTDTGLVWTGNASANWSDSGNWSGLTAPSNGQVLLFAGSNTANINNLTGLQAGGLQFNANAGAFNFSGGSIQLSKGLNNLSANSQTIGLNIVLAGNLTMNVLSPITISGVLSDGGAGYGISINGSSTVVLAASNTYSGTTTVNSGVLQLGNGTANGSVAGNIVNNALLVLEPATTVTLNGAISGMGSVTQMGPGSTVLAGSNTYSGATTVSGGTLGLTGSLLGSCVTGNSGLFTESPSGVIGGAGATFTVSNGGSATLGGSNTYSGPTTVSGGTLGLTGTLAGSCVTVAGGFFTESPSGVIGGAGATFTVSSGSVILSGSNTYSGNTLVSGGTLALGSGLALQNSTFDTSGSGTLSFGALTAATFGGIINSGNLSLTNTASAPLALSVGNNGASTTYSGAMSGSGGSLTKLGAGMLTLTAANSYGGGTTISEGTLQVTQAGVAGSGPISIAAGSMLSVYAASTTCPTVSNVLTGSGTISFSSFTTATSNICPALANSATGFTGTIAVNTSEPYFFPIFGTSGNLLDLSNATLVVTGQNYANPSESFVYTSLSNGTIKVGELDGNGTLGSNNFTNTTWQIGGLNTNSTFSGRIANNWLPGNTGITALTKVGSGMLTLSGSNTYSGPTTISGGTLQIGNGGSGESIGKTPSVSLANSATLAFNHADTVTFAAPISGTGAVVQAGSGTLILKGNNSYSGDTTVSGGMLQMGASCALALGSGGLTANGGTVDLNGNNLTTGGTNALAYLAGAAGTITDNNTTGGTPATILTVNQAGNTTFGGRFLIGNYSPGIYLQKYGAGSLTLGGTSTLSGATVNNSGTLAITGSVTTIKSSAVNTSATLLVNGGLATTNLSVNGTAQLAGSGTINVTSSAGEIDVTSTKPFTFGGTVTGVGGLEADTPASRVTLTGANNYSGATLVDGGAMLTAGAAYTLSPSSAVSVSGTLDVTAGVQTVSSLSMNGGGVLNLAIGNTLTGSGTANLAGLGTLSVSGNIGLLPDLLMNFSGGLSGSFSSTLYNGGTLPTADAWSYSGGSLEIVSAVTPFTGFGTWTGGPNWSSSGNWTDAAGSHGVPGDGSRGNNVDTAAFSGSGSTAITLDISPTVAALSFSNSSYTLSGPGTLTLSNTTGTVPVTVNGGTQAIGSAITLASSLSVTLNNSGELALNGNVGESPVGQALTLGGDGSGTLVLAGTNSYTGGTYVDAGTLIANNSSALADGSGLVVGAGGTFVFDPTVAGAPTTAAPQIRRAGVEAVPEPGTIALLIAGLVAGVGVRQWRTRRA